MEKTSCDLRCKACQIKGCCACCKFGRSFGERNGSLVIVCDYFMVSHKTKFAKNEPIIVETCKKWKPRYPQNFK